MVSVQRGRCLTCFWPLRHHIFDYMLQRRNLLAVQLTVRIDETTNQTFQWHHVFAAISIVDTSKKINNSVSENSSKIQRFLGNVLIKKLTRLLLDLNCQSKVFVLHLNRPLIRLFPYLSPKLVYSISYHCLIEFF